MVGRSSLPRSGRSSDARRSEPQLDTRIRREVVGQMLDYAAKRPSQNSGQTQATTTAEILPTARSQKRTPTATDMRCHFIDLSEKAHAQR